MIHTHSAAGIGNRGSKVAKGPWHAKDNIFYRPFFALLLSSVAGAARTRVHSTFDSPGLESNGN